MENDKYVVFKAKEFDDWLASDMKAPIPVALHDAIVIRRQDIFAGPGLFAYANAIQTAIDLMGQDMSALAGWELNQMARLEELRDFFWEQAMMASHEERKKVPD